MRGTKFIHTELTASTKIRDVFVRLKGPERKSDLYRKEEF